MFCVLRNARPRQKEPASARQYYRLQDWADCKSYVRHANIEWLSCLDSDCPTLSTGLGRAMCATHKGASCELRHACSARLVYKHRHTSTHCAHCMGASDNSQRSIAIASKAGYRLTGFRYLQPVPAAGYRKPVNVSCLPEAGFRRYRPLFHRRQQPVRNRTCSISYRPAGVNLTL